MLTLAELDRAARREQYWTLALASSGLMLAWLIYFEILERRFHWELPGQGFRYAEIAVLSGIVLWVWSARRTATARQFFLAGVLTFVPLPVILWLHQEFARTQPWLEPLGPNRVAIILVALLFPGRPRAVALAVAVVALTGIVHVEVWRAQGVLPRTVPHEPWILAFHWAVAGLIIGLRVRLERTQRRYQRTRAALAALAQLAAASRALRDGVNTPLQTIDTVAFLERHLDPRLHEAAGRLERSTDQLRRVLNALKDGDVEDWQLDDLSFRAEQQLAALQADLRRDARLP